MATITPSGTVRLIKGVPFSITENHNIYFKNQEEQFNYFTSLDFKQFDESTYVRGNGNIKVELTKDEAMQYNYLMYQNPSFSNKWFYCYVTSVVYVAPKVTRIFYKIDSWQSFCFDIDFKASFIEREHAKEYEADGTPVVNTIPENLDYGSEYNVVYADYGHSKIGGYYWLVIATTLTTEDIVNETFPSNSFYNCYGGVPSNLTYFYFPINFNELSQTAYSGSQMISNVNNNEYNINNIINTIRNGSNLVGKIVNMYITADVPFSYQISQNTLLTAELKEVEIYTNVDGDGNKTGSLKMLTLNPNSSTGTIGYKMKKESVLTDKYYHFEKPRHSKLLMYPYSFIELTDYNGNNLIIKPEYIKGNEIEILTYASVGNSQKIAYAINNYLGLTDEQTLDYLPLENALINQSPNNIPIIDDYTASYIQGNANTIKTSILTNEASNTAQENASLFKGLFDSLAQTPIAMSGGLSGDFNQMNIANINEYTGLTSTMSNYGAQRINNTVQEVNLVRNILAKVQDTRNMPDSVRNLTGNIEFNVGYAMLGWHLLFKQITPEYQAILNDYFDKYGYEIHRFKRPNLNTRKSWNYVKTVKANITGNIPNDFLEDLQSIFNRGITLWHTTDVGNYSLDNSEI